MLRLQVDGAAVQCAWYPFPPPSDADGELDPAGHRGTQPAPASLLFLHEGLGSLTQWQGFPAEVCRRSGRSGWAWARAGHGRSQPLPRPRDETFLHREATRTVPELVARLGLDRPVLVGHSDGASIALIAAANAPGAYRSLVLMAPHVFLEPCTREGIAAVGRRYRDGELGRRLARHHDDADRLFWSWHDVWLSPAFAGWDLTGLLAAIDVPVLLVQGHDDEYGTMAQLDAIEAAVCGPVERLELEGCGHSPHLEAREATSAAIVAFLERHG